MRFGLIFLIFCCLWSTTTEASLRGGFLVQIQPQDLPPSGSTAVYPELGIYHLAAKPLITSQFKNVWSNDEIQIEPEPVIVLPWEPVPIDWNLQWTQARQAQTLTKGAGVVVAVLDSGITETDETRGRVRYDLGYDFVNERPEAKDDFGHGTQVASLIIGTTLGVAPEAQVLPIKFLDKNGMGSIADSIRAFRWAIQKKVPIINASWGNPSWSWSLWSTVYKAAQQSLVVASAGNQGVDLKDAPNYPASFNFSGIITVGATDIHDKLSGFSNYGSKVHLAAPGQNVRAMSMTNAVQEVSGTSFSTPAVSGTAALVLALHPQESNDLKKCLSATVDRPPLNVKSRGRVNTLRAVEKCL